MSGFKCHAGAITALYPKESISCVKDINLFEYTSSVTMAESQINNTAIIPCPNKF